MERRYPRVGDIYRHFQGKTYIVAGFAKNATNNCGGQKMVVYFPVDQYPLFDRDYCCRELEEFMSPVDKVKYPVCEKQWRFEKIGSVRPEED